MAVSKLAKKPIPFPANVNIAVGNNELLVSCGTTNGSVRIDPESVEVRVNSNDCLITLTRKPKNPAMLGTVAAKLKNLIRDCQEPYKVVLKLIGVGFKAFSVDDGVIALNIGLSHLVAFKVPNSVKIDIKDNTEVTISGLIEDATLFADDVCRVAPWDPCLQSGIVKEGQFLRRKEGKKK